MVLTGLLVVAMSHAAFAQETQPSDDETPPVQQFGGVGSVPGQLADDERLTESLTGKTFGQDYLDWKSTVHEKQIGRASCRERV